MVIYVELFLLSNLAIHLVSIFVIGKILDIKITKGVIISSILDVIWMLAYIYCFDLFNKLRYLVGIILVIISYKFRFKDAIKTTIFYYLLNFMLGGVGFCLKLSGNLFYLIITFCYLLIATCIYIVLVNKKYETYYEISFFLDKKRSYKAFFDTGCNLTYKGAPVLIISERRKFLVKNCGNILIQGATGTVIKPVFLIEDVLINKKHLKAYGVFLDVEFEAIIGVSFV